MNPIKQRATARSSSISKETTRQSLTMIGVEVDDIQIIISEIKIALRELSDLQSIDLSEGWKIAVRNEHGFIIMRISYHDVKYIIYDELHYKIKTRQFKYRCLNFIYAKFIYILKERRRYDRDRKGAGSAVRTALATGPGPRCARLSPPRLLAANATAGRCRPVKRPWMGARPGDLGTGGPLGTGGRWRDREWDWPFRR